MARIIGPAGGNATIEGTAEDDVIVALGAGNTISGNGGSDVVSAGRLGGATVLIGGTLDGLTGLHPIVRLCGAGNALVGGDEAFEVVSYGPGARLDLGNGDDAVIAYGAGNSITVGIGRNTVVAGSGSSVLVRSPDPGVIGVGYADTVRFAGTGNRLTVDAYGQRYPLSGTLDVSGGSGSGTFDMGWGSGSLVTHGRGNVVRAGLGTVDISPGDGGSEVHLSGLYQTAGNATVRLAGDHDVVGGTVTSAKVTGGTGYARVDLEALADGRTVEVGLGGEDNVVRLTGFESTIDAGSGHATVAVSFGSARVTTHGAGNRVFIDSPAVAVVDQSDGLVLEMFGLSGTTTVENFGAARGAVVQLDDSGFASAQDAAAAVRSDGAGGSVLLAPGGGSISFLGVTGLTADNFRIATFGG